MRRVIKKNIKGYNIKSKQECIKVLLASGLIIKDTDILEFSERRNFTTHSGKNKQKIFSPLLKGKLSIEAESNSIIWDLNINGILLKSVLAFVSLTLLWLFLIQGNWINSLVLGAVISLILFGINWLNLNNQIEKLTNEMLLK